MGDFIFPRKKTKNLRISSNNKESEMKQKSDF